jgi:DNA-binding transcriptional MerR regulator
MDRRNFKVASDALDIRYYGWFLVNEESIKFKSLVSQKKHRLADDRFSSRIINHWQKEGLIDDNRPNGKGWRKYSLSDIVWIHVISEIRDFGLSIDKLLKVKTEIERETDSNHNISERPLFDYYLLTAMLDKVPVYLHVFKDGEALFFTRNELEIAQQIGTIEGSYLTINLHKILNKVYDKEMNKPDYFTPLPLEEGEKELLDSLRRGGIESVQIDLKDGAIVSMTDIITESKDSRIVDLLSMNNFQEIVIKQHQGEVTRIERKIKTRPKKGK